MCIAIAADHGGFALTEALKAYLQEPGHEVADFAQSDVSCDSPDFRRPSKMLALEEER